MNDPIRKGDLLPPGLYEALLTEALRQRLPHTRAECGPLPDDGYELLTRHVALALNRALKSTQLSAEAQVELCNALLREIESQGPVGVVVPGDMVPAPAELLTEIRRAEGGLHDEAHLPRPETALSEDTLFVNAPHEPGLAAELRREIESADRIDLICAFIVWNGVRILLAALESAARRRVPIRVLTTTYTGITDPRALDELERLGAEVKVSYEARSTRLHAKAWLFERDSGFSTAYIGSSNLTHTALHEGLEWNVRVSQVRSPALLDRFRAAFETYWSDAHFERYDRAKFSRAIARNETEDGVDLTPFEIVPFEYQRAMLDTLQAERERHNRWQNLVVAATGTGKTVVAAFDYKRVAAAWQGASLLFVAHREEILRQSRTLFRHVLRQGDFGELLVGGRRPTQGRHVFASVQSLAHMDLDAVPANAFDVIIIDEFHHAEASTYRRLLAHFHPQLLLGLTATPERTDERDVLHWFGGRIAVELRLWDALDQGLLCPFQYFGVADEVDLRDLEWKRTGYDIRALSDLYTGNDLRTAKILQATRDLIARPNAMKALGFCVSVEHAHYMAASFERAGIPARAVTGETPAPLRHEVIRDLQAGRINAVFTVDVFNEGVDIPPVDTVLLLRPTESSTVFFQQIGRGLRLAEGKSGLTVLDFIGQQRREFRFAPRFQALTGMPASKLEKAVESGFPYLPPGCYIHLDRVAASIVLDNLKSAIRTRRDLLVSDLRQLGDVPLARFVRETGHSVREVYLGSRPGWMSLRRDAGLSAPPPREGDGQLVAAIGRMLHIDDDERLQHYCAWLAGSIPPNAKVLSSREVRLLHMLHFDLAGQAPESTPLQHSLDRIWQQEAIRQELLELLLTLEDTSNTLIIRQQGEEPLSVHAHYTRNELLAALGVATAEHPRPMREGVLWVPTANADIFLVTLRKSEQKFSPTTMYRDYAISPREFHWESQSTTSVSSPTGQRYIHQRQRGTRVLLFARETSAQRDYLYLGPAHYVQHSGDRPISFVWQLEYEMPAPFFLEARAVS